MLRTKTVRLVVAVVVLTLALPLAALSWTGYVNAQGGNASSGNALDCPSGMVAAIAVKGTSDTGAKVRYRNTAVQSTPNVITFNGNVERSYWFVFSTNDNVIYGASGNLLAHGRMQGAVDDKFGPDGPVTGIDIGCVNSSFGYGWFSIPGSNDNPLSMY